MTALITIRDLSMVFDGTEALKKISFEIGEGEIVGIIGRSGAVKTVLMHLLRGVDQPPTSGQVIYHVVRCAGCGRVELPSRAGQSCPGCGGTYAPVDVDLWATENEGLKREVMARTAIMFQRTFALYGNDRVIENVLHALDDIDYPS